MIESEERLFVWAGESLDETVELAVPGGTIIALTAGSPDEPDRVNQDAAGVVIHDSGALLIIADGAGGLPAGDRASEAAVRALAETARSALAEGLPLREGVLQGFEDATQAVRALGVGAGTTLVAAEVHASGSLRTYHAGDSRALVCGQRGKLKMLTMAHSPVGYQVQAGLLGEAEALHHQGLHFVENLVGMNNARVEVGPTLVLSPRDTFVAGSDGLFDNLGPEEVIDAIRKGALGRAGATLAARARERMRSVEGDAPSKPDDLSFVLFRRRRLDRGKAVE